MQKILTTFILETFFHSVLGGPCHCRRRGGRCNRTRIEQQTQQSHPIIPMSTHLFDNNVGVGPSNAPPPPTPQDPVRHRVFEQPPSPSLDRPFYWLKEPSDLEVTCAPSTDGVHALTELRWCRSFHHRVNRRRREKKTFKSWRRHRWCHSTDKDHDPAA
jgi:hypothetical protein